MKIISIGDLVLDYYYLNDKLIGVNGGMSSHNIILNLKHLGHNVSVSGVCGDDAAGMLAIKSLSDEKIDVSHIKQLNGIETRKFHVSYYEEGESFKFKSKKRCPYCNKKSWYNESLIDINVIINILLSDDIVVIDNLNNSNIQLLSKIDNKVMLDLGQYFEFEELSDDEVKEKLNYNFELVNLNERVSKYFVNRFKLNNITEIIKAKLIIITKGKKGATFYYNNTINNLDLKKIGKETDPTGAGDAFFSMFISEYIKNNYNLTDDFIVNSFNKANKLVLKVVSKIGARSHLQNSYKIKKTNSCTCESFDVSIRKQIKRVNVNVNNLERRIINSISDDIYKKIENIGFENNKNIIITGTGGSYASSVFVSKVLNNLYKLNSYALYPRDILYRNNEAIDKVILLSYSGTTEDLITSTKNIDNSKKIIITKGEVKKVTDKTLVSKENIISYRTTNNKGKERGFLAFEGVMVPSSLFLKLYFSKTNINNNIEKFIKNQINYWNDYFDMMFKENKKIFKEKLIKGNIINLFHGDYSNSAAYDIESKIIESGYFNILLHEKKNFSHGRFINYEHLSYKINIILLQNSISKYEEVLLDYLKDDFSITLRSNFDGILAEYDLLLASQYFTYYLSKFIDVDLSKPSYSEEAMKVYFYKGEL